MLTLEATYRKADDDDDDDDDAFQDGLSFSTNS
jgi:hypothetical protein